MRIPACLLLLVLISCGQKSGKKEPPVRHDSIGPVTDTTVGNRQTIADSTAMPSPMETAVNAVLKAKSTEPWVVTNDAMANWPRDVFDYFIAPKRKTDPGYPYLVKGDFNGDGREDAAALVRLKDTAVYQLAIIESMGTDAASIRYWKEDMDLSALSVYPKGSLEGLHGEKIKMKGDGINVEYYETSSFVIYWSGSAYKRVWTGD